MNLANAKIAQLLIPVEFADPDGNQLALMSEVALESA